MSDNISPLKSARVEQNDDEATGVKGERQIMENTLQEKNSNESQPVKKQEQNDDDQKSDHSLPSARQFDVISNDDNKKSEHSIDNSFLERARLVTMKRIDEDLQDKAIVFK